MPLFISDQHSRAAVPVESSRSCCCKSHSVNMANMVKLFFQIEVAYVFMDQLPLRTCSYCKEPKTLDNFNKKRKGLQPYCKPCSRVTSKMRYEANRSVHIARVGENRRKRKDKIREWLTDYLSTHPCVDCGSTDIRILEFDHVKGEKSYNISSMLKEAYSVEKVADEVNKCEVRCANCHNIVTVTRSQNWRHHAYEASKNN